MNWIPASHASNAPTQIQRTIITTSDDGDDGDSGERSDTMVFIVKIPNRSRANTPEASTTTPSPEAAPMQEGFHADAHPSRLPVSDSASAAGPTSDTANVGGSHNGSKMLSGEASASTSNASTSTPTPAAAELDILLAPSVLKHRYVRGVDKSLIVERPERIRAVLLGIATAIGKSSTSDHHPPLLPSSIPTNAFQTSPTPASRSLPAADATSTTAPPLPSIKAPSAVDDDDDLVARLNSLSVQGNAVEGLTPQAQQKFRVLHSTRSLPLDPTHPAVAFTHAHSDELVTVLESAYDQAKQKRKDARAAMSDSMQLPKSDPLTLQAPATDATKAEREATPTPSSVAADSKPPPTAAPSSSAPRTSHAAYLEYLCSRAPNHPPLSHRKPSHASPSKSIPDDSEAYTSSDGEGDDAMHLSEVPDHLPQGDLYLAGPSHEGSLDGGSAEAIRHAMGACCEAVDRVVSAAHSTTSTPLREITIDSSIAGGVGAPPAKRAFVLSRPPGHHCSGSTPQGFCWVNNAIVSAAHGYLSHSIDRVVIFDIDLHHGNGTQNLAWRINADANRHDDQRTERIAGLRAAALERARQAMGSGHGRAHASRVAKVTLSEADEEEVRRQAGKRALRVFYGSLHDIESFPCEDGDAGMIKDASTCVEGAHGQWIWNIHLDQYRTDPEFAQLYTSKYTTLFSKATRFLTSTSSLPATTLVLISCGFDACSYEYPGMQRHGKHVPPSFYHTFARDAVSFADTHAAGKLVSVLEGGYSDRALCSAALAHVSGLAGEGEEEWWKLDNLLAVERVAKRMAAHAAEAGANTTPKRRQAELAPWLATTSKAFAAFERACGKNVVAIESTATPQRGAAARLTADTAASSPAGRVLRARKSRANFGAGDTPQPTRRAASPTKATQARGKRESPSKAREAGAELFGTPVKVEPKQEDMAMDTDTPTRSTTAVDLPSAFKSAGFARVAAQPQQAASSDPPQPPSIAPNTTRSPARAPFNAATFLSTPSNPPSPPLTATPVTLVDALSRSPHRVVDANTSNALGLDGYAVSGGDEADAEGELDPNYAPLPASRVEQDGHFPNVVGREESLPPGGMAWSANPISQPRGDRERSLYPTLPTSYASPPRKH